MKQSQMTMLQAAIILSVTIGIITRFIQSYYTEISIFHALSFFTMQSNLMVLLWTGVTVLHNHKKINLDLSGFYHGAVTTYISITMMVYITVITPRYNPVGVAWWASLFNHYITPSLFILYYFLTERIAYQKIWPFYWLLYPLLYLVFLLISGFYFSDFIYFSVDSADVTVGDILFWVGPLCALFLIVGYCYVYLSYRLQKLVKV